MGPTALQGGSLGPFRRQKSTSRVDSDAKSERVGDDRCVGRNPRRRQLRSPKRTRKRFEDALTLVPDLREDDRAAMRVLMRVGEWELALDTMCTQIHEYDVHLTHDARRHLDQIGEDVGVPVSSLLGDPDADEPSVPGH